MVVLFNSMNIHTICANRSQPDNLVVKCSPAGPCSYTIMHRELIIAVHSRNFSELLILYTINYPTTKPQNLILIVFSQIMHKPLNHLLPFPPTKPLAKPSWTGCPLGFLFTLILFILVSASKLSHWRVAEKNPAQTSCVEPA